MQDHQLSCHQIAKRLHISSERADKMLTKGLGSSKFPQGEERSFDSWNNKATSAMTNLELFEAGAYFLVHCITMNESWIYHYQPETKEQSK